jgi:uncharacterized protein (DUF433 family)
MTMLLHADPVPLRMDEQGAIRFEGSRVTLDTVIENFKSGLLVETIARGYDTVRPADIYAAIAYYLRHTDEVEAYLTRREEEAKALKNLMAERFPVAPELLAKIRAFDVEVGSAHGPVGK